MTAPLSDDLESRVDSLFAPADRARARRLLAACGPDLPFADSLGPDGIDRVRRAVLTLSNGSLAGLETMIGQAHTDWRDVLVAAGDG